MVVTRIVIGPTVACLEFGHVSPVPPKDLRHKVTCARSAAGDCTYIHQHDRSTTLRSRMGEGIANGKQPESGVGAATYDRRDRIRRWVRPTRHRLPAAEHGSIANRSHGRRNCQGVFVVVAVLLVLRHHRRAPEAAVAVGFASAALFVYAHLSPTFLPEFQDSFITGPRINVTWFSWLTAVAEIGTAVIFGFAGLRSLRAFGSRHT